MSERELWIRCGTVVTGAGRQQADVLLRGDKIAVIQERPATGPSRAPLADQAELDVSGLWVLPGGVDAHVHFGMPLSGGICSLGWRESSEAALLGGTTTVIDFANPGRGESLPAALDRWQERAAGACVCDFGLHVTISEVNAARLAELPQVISRGVPTMKAFLAYPDRLMLEPQELAQLMRAVSAAGGHLLVHAEDGRINEQAARDLARAGRTAVRWHAAAHPARAERQAVITALDMALAADCRLTLVHLSIGDSVDLLRQARLRAGADGDLLTGEVCLHHLFRDDSLYAAGEEDALRAVLSPPIRPAADGRRLLAGLVAGDLQLLSTDHCEFPLAVKRQAARRGFAAVPNGAGGVAERLTISHARAVHPGLMTPERWVQCCCEEPARRMGLQARKGRIAEGLDADLVVFDPERPGTWRPVGASDPQSSLWTAEPCQGAVVHVFRRGEHVVQSGRLAPDLGPGLFLERRF